MEKKSNLRYHLELVISCIIAILLVMTFVRIHQQHIILGNQPSIRSSRMLTRRYRGLSKDCTEKNLKDDYDSSEPNLDKVISANRSRIKKGMSLAFNRCQTNSAYNRQKPYVDKILGSSVGNKVLKVVRPKVSPGFTTSSEHSMASSLLSCKISYGRFNELSHSIPVDIVVNYRTPPLRSQTNPNKKTYTGTVVVNASLFTNDNSMSETNEYDAMSQAFQNDLDIHQ